jgi:hypothetical protein
VLLEPLKFLTDITLDLIGVREPMPRVVVVWHCGQRGVQPLGGHVYETQGDTQVLPRGVTLLALLGCEGEGESLNQVLLVHVLHTRQQLPHIADHKLEATVSRE